MPASRFAKGLGILVSVTLVGCATTVDRASSVPSIASSPASSPSPPQPSGDAVPESPLATAIAGGRKAAWLNAGKLHEARNRAHVVIVAKGKVLVVGSDNVCMPASGGSDSVELGDPMTIRWKKVASLRSPREGPALVALHDGRALVTGGSTGEEAGPASYSSAYVFGPAKNTWTKTGLMSSARSALSAAVLDDGRVLVAGGYYADPAHGNLPAPVLDSSELWDPATGDWSTTGRMAHARFGASAVTLSDGRVLILGGSASLETAPVERNSAEIYDPASGRWSPAGSLAQARIAPSLVALSDGGALVVGGLISEPPDDFGVFQHPTTSVERFDALTGAWSRTADVSVAAIGQAAIRLSDGQILVAGGDVTVNEPDLDTTPAALTKVAEIYDPTSGTWHGTAALPRPRSGASAVLLDDGTVLLVGGIKTLNPDDTPSCPVPDPDVWRFVPAG
jgi:hypothetical protein